MIQHLKDEFEKFWDILEKQIEVCPETLWGAKAGNYFYWQQIWHVMVSSELATIEDPKVRTPSVDKYSWDVVMLSKTLDHVPPKAEMLEESRRIKKMALDYFNGLSVASLLLPHPRMSNRFGKPKTKLHAALALIRHVNYHIGSCDTALREHAHPGVLSIPDGLKHEYEA